MSSETVTQAARDAAADVAQLHMLYPTPIIDDIRDGKRDYLGIVQTIARHRAPDAEPVADLSPRARRYLADEKAAREATAALPERIQQRLEAWQTHQHEWFSDTLLEIVAEFIAYEDTHPAKPVAQVGSKDFTAFAEKLRQTIKTVGPFKFDIWRREDYSGEHRTWKEEYTLPVHSILAEQIIEAALAAMGTKTDDLGEVI